MSGLKLLFIFSAFLMIQAQCRLQDDTDGDGSNEIIIIPTAAFTIIQKIVDTVTEFGISAINGLNEHLTEIEEQLYSVEKVIVDLLWVIVVHNLNEMEEDASDFGKATIQCVKEQGDDLQSIVLNFATQSLTCEAQKTVMILNTYVPILIEIQSTNQDMKNITEQFIECENDGSARACIDEVVDQIWNSLSDLRTTLSDEISQASKFIDNITRFATLCHNDAQSKLQDTAKNISSTVTECIEQKTLNNTSN